MPEHDNRPPRLVLPVIVPGGKPDSVAFNNAFQLWARDLNAWLNDNLVPSRASTTKKFTHCHVCGPGYQYGDEGCCHAPLPGSMLRPLPNQADLDFDGVAESPCPEWLPGDFKERVGLIARSKIEVGAAAVGEVVEKLVTTSYDEWLVRMGHVDNRSAAPYWMRRAERAEAERDKAIQERDFWKGACEDARVQQNKAIQERDACVSTVDHIIEILDGAKVPREGRTVQQRVGQLVNAWRENYERAVRAENDAAKWQRAQRDEYAVVRQALDKIEAAGGAKAGNIIARVDHLILERDAAKKELHDELEKAFLAYQEQHAKIREERDALLEAAELWHKSDSIRRAEAAEAKVARVQAYAAGLTKGNEADRCRSAEILAVLDDTITEVSGE